jgi:hypothetical protein
MITNRDYFAVVEAFHVADDLSGDTEKQQSQSTEHAPYGNFNAF